MHTDRYIYIYLNTVHSVLTKSPEFPNRARARIYHRYEHANITMEMDAYE